MLRPILAVGAILVLAFFAYVVVLDAWLRGPDKHEGKLQTLLGSAEECYQKEKFDESIRAYDEAIQLNPNDVELYRRRAFPRRAKGDLDGAIADLDEAIRRYPEFADAYHQRGIARWLKGDEEAATEDFERAARLRPGDPQSQFALGMIRGKRSQWKQAVESYDAALRLAPEYAAAYFKRGVARSILGREDEALEDFDHAIRLEPKNAEAYVQRGELRSERDEFEAAIADYSAALERTPDDVLTRRKRALDRRASGLLEEAEADYDRVIVLAPHWTVAYQERGVIRFERGDVRGAIEDFDAALQRPPAGDVHILRSLARLANDDFDGAVADAERAVEYNPRDGAARRIRGLGRLRRNEFAEALEDFKVAIQWNPNDDFSLVGPGLEVVAPDSAKAAVEFETALGLDPSIVAAEYVERGVARQYVGAYAAALRDFEEAIRLEPENPVAFHYAARLRTVCPVDAIRNPAEAVRLATKGCELTEWKDFHLLFALAAAYSETGDFASAAKFQKQTIDDLRRSTEIGHGVDSTYAKRRLFDYRRGKPFRSRPVAGTVGEKAE